MADDKDSGIEAKLAQQNELIAALQQQIADLAARVPAPEEPAPQPRSEYPRAVYRPHKKVKLGQIDHPGQDSKVVKTEAECVAALAQGWQKDPLPHVDLDEEREAQEQAKQEGLLAAAAGKKGGKTRAA